MGVAADALIRSSFLCRCRMLPVSSCRAIRPFEGPPLALSGTTESSLQSAGVGGTVSRLVPCPSVRLARSGSVGTRSKYEVSMGLFKLCVLAELGGGPGGGGGKGMPGSHAGEELEATGVEPLPKLISPVDAALLAAGALLVGLSSEHTCACSDAKVVLSWRESTGFTGDVALVLLREVIEESSRPACPREDDRSLDAEF